MTLSTVHLVTFRARREEVTGNSHGIRSRVARREGKNHRRKTNLPDRRDEVTFRAKANSR